jgi:hypothetical protein
MRFSLVFIICLAIFAVAQGQVAERGGGVIPGGGPTFNVSVVAVEELDEVTTHHHNPATGLRTPNHWTNFGRDNGNQIVGMFGLGLTPPIPASHDPNINLPVQITSQGSQKVVVQYSSPINEMPELVGVTLISNSKAYYSEGGNATADNGIGDESTYIASNINPEFMGLSGEYSTGKHLRFVKLNSAEYGELEFNSSASAYASGEGARDWADAQAAGATLDPWSISLSASIANSPNYKVGPTTHRFIDMTIAGITKTFYVSEESREAISPTFPSTHTTLFEFPYGLARSEHDINSPVPMENEWVRDLSGHSTWTEESILQYRSQGKISHFSWNISHPSFLTGSIMHPNSGNVHEYGIYTSETRTNTHEIETPYRTVRYGLGWPFNTTDEQLAFNSGSLVKHDSCNTL